MLKLTIPAKAVNFHFLGGGYSAYRLSGQLYKNTEDYEVEIPGSTKISGNFKRIDYGLSFGAGLSIDLISASLLLEVRYNHGLVNIYKTKYSSFKVKNRSLSFMIGFGF